MNQSTSPKIFPSCKDPCLQELQKLLGERLSLSESVREQHGRDESFHASAPPEAVAFAESNEEVAEIVRICVKHKNRLSRSAPELPSKVMSQPCTAVFV